MKQAPSTAPVRTTASAAPGQDCRTSASQLARQAEAEGLLTPTSPRKQFRPLNYDEANPRKARRSTNQAKNLIGLLESRLDAIVYRAKFVPTPFAARQFVSHGHVKVNGRRVNIPSYRCKPGDLVEVREKSKNLLVVLEAISLAERDVPEYIDVDHQKMTATYVRQPGLGDVPYPVTMEPNLVVEFYSR